MIVKPKFAPAVICILTFCCVTAVSGDAVIPFGYIFAEALRDPDLQWTVRILLLVPIVGLLASSFINHSRKRCIVVSGSALGLIILWLLVLILFVVYPRIPTPYPTSAKVVPAVTSIPFLVAIVATITLAVRKSVAEPRFQTNRSQW